MISLKSKVARFMATLPIYFSTYKHDKLPVIFCTRLMFFLLLGMFWHLVCRDNKKHVNYYVDKINNVSKKG